MTQSTRRTLKACMAGVLLALAWAVFPAPAPAAGPCTDVEIVGLRGSGENPPRPEQHDMGALVGPVADAIAAQLSEGATVGFHGIRYPAGDASITTVLSRSYFRSKDQGVSDLRAYLTARIAACPATKLVVMGYSQGAHAAGDLLAASPASITNRVAALVMFGDPRFNPAASYTWGSFDSRNHGLAGARSSSDFASWSRRVFSFCNQYDPVCQGADKFITHGGDAHGQARYRANYEALAAGLVRRVLGFTTPARVPLDLAFVIDSTGSMGNSIDGVASAAANMVNTFNDNGADFRVGLVDYKDTDQGDPYAARLDLNMTRDADAFGDAVGALDAFGGGDWPEAVYSGLMTAFGELDWRVGARRAVVLMGDAQAKDPEPVTGYTSADVLAAARAAGSRAAAADGATAIYPLAVGSDPIDSFRPLADGTGGELFESSDPSSVADDIVEVVDAAAAPVYVTLSAPALVRPGMPVALFAHAHYGAGEVVSYAWDFDGDGATDATTAAERIAHTYAAPYSGQVTVTALTDDGHSAAASAAIVVSADAPLPAGAPRNLTAAPGSGEVVLGWTAPADLAGGTLAGYQVRIDDAASGQPVATVFTAPSAGGTSVGALEPGSYTATVAAATEAGIGAPSTVPFAIAGPAVPAPPIVTPPPSAPPGAAPKARVAQVRWRGRRLRLRVRCPAGAPSACRVGVTVSARKGRRFRRVASRRVTVQRGAWRRVTVAVSRAAYARLRRKGVALRLTVRTATQLGTATDRRKLRRPPHSSSRRAATRRSVAAASRSATRTWRSSPHALPGVT